MIAAVYSFAFMCFHRMGKMLTKQQVAVKGQIDNKQGNSANGNFL